MLDSCPSSVWDIKTVTCAGFSQFHLVAMGDLSGLLKVWQVATKEGIWYFEAGAYSG